MITNVRADGFKSLRNFSLSLRPGLNVLVGPNGAGKTNIISLFEFLSFLPVMDLGEAFSAIGGAGSAFRRMGQSDYSTAADIMICGSCKCGNKRHVYYEYSASMAISESTEIVYYKRQQLRIQFRTVESRSDYRPKPTAVDIDISTEVDEVSDEKPVKVHIERLNSKRLEKRSSRFEGKKSQFREYVEEYFNDFDAISESIINCGRVLGDDLFPILQDMVSSKYYNIVPSNIRTGEDAASDPIINKDGSGLSATLWAIKKMASRGRRRIRPVLYHRRFMYRLPNVTLQEIVQYVRMANPTIEDIDVTSSPFDNKLQVLLSISDEAGKSCQLPLSAMSDGTLKWIAFITLLLSKRSIFAVEEPENYLHPSMQAELIQLMRTFSEKKGQILISTHSETVLNSLRPDEVIVVSFSSGCTQAKWLETASELDEEIKRTGFGLGYYYVTGAVE